MRRFGAVLCSLPRSRRWQRLGTDNARLTYVLLLSSQFANSAGTFILPPQLFDVTAKREPGQGEAAYRELASVGLIKWDEGEQIVQIPGWFRANPIQSRKQLAGPLKILTESLPRSPARDSGMAELVIHLHERANEFSPDHEAKPAFLDTASRLAKTYKLEPIIAEMPLSKDLLIALSEDLLIALPIQGHRQRQRQNTDRDIDTDRDRDRDRDIKKTRARANGPPSRPSPPAKSGRAGKQPPDDVKATIDHLQSRAKDAK